MVRRGGFNNAGWPMAVSIGPARKAGGGMSDTISDFANQMTIEQSSRSQVLMLMGFFGYSSGGKTVTSLIAATGLVGADAKIGIIDTEQKRSGLAVDVVKQLAMQRYGKTPEFVVIHLEAPFHPLKYVAGLRKLQEAGCKAITVDSMSHSWSCYLELKEEALERMAGDDWKKREKCAMAAAAKVKPHTHGKLIDALLHMNVPMILCFRGKEKTRMEKDDQNKTQIQRDEFATPIHEEGLIYEMLISGECRADENGVGGYCRFTGPGTKHTHPQLLALLPKPNEQFGFQHAEAIAQWCANPGSSPTTQPTKPQPSGPGKMLLDLRNLTASIHKWDGKKESWESAKAVLETWLVSQTIIADTETLASLSPDRLIEVLSETRAALNSNPQDQKLL
jgi:hypothetical protein